MALLAERTLEYVRILKGSEHAVAVYDNPEDKWRLVSTHIAEAFDKGGGAFYVCYFENPQDVRAQLKRHGIDTDLHEKRGDFTIVEFGDYIKEERFYKIGSELSEISNQLLTKGGHIREADDLTPAIKSGYAEEVLKFERMAGSTLKWPIAAICAYETRAVIDQGRKFFTELAKAHGHIILRGVAEKLQ